MDIEVTKSQHDHVHDKHIISPFTRVVTSVLSAVYFLHAVSQAEQIIYSTESCLEEENDAIVKQVVASHNKSLQSSSDTGKLRKFRSMPHVMRSFFQSGTSSGSSSSGSNDNYSGSDGKPNKINAYLMKYFYFINS